MNHPMKRHDRNMFPVFFNRFWDNDFFSNSWEADMPAVNVKENKKSFKVDISVPGFEKDDIHVEVNKNILTISGKREVNKEEKGEDDKVLRQEFSSSSFSRSFTLPEDIDTEAIDAKQKDGVLKITLPKKEKALESAKKKIEIK